MTQGMRGSVRLQPGPDHVLRQAADELPADDAASAGERVGVAMAGAARTARRLDHPGDAARVQVRCAAARLLHEEPEPPLREHLIERPACFGGELEIDDVRHAPITRIDLASDPFSFPTT